MSASGAGQTRLTFSSATSDVSPEWSPDGTKIAFVASTGYPGENQIWTMSADGSHQTLLMAHADEPGGPSWQRTLSSPATVSCHVPNVVGQKLAKAETKIRARHCRVGKIVKKASSPARKGRILSESPRVGKTLKKGARVNLTVGKG